MSVALEVKNLSKSYQLGSIGTGTLTRDLERFYARLCGKEDPLWRIGANQQLHTATEKTIWSLKDINFELEAGETLGVIGRNGAGKSTLLKILSRVTTPTTGFIKGNGRIASLLEVGTGFHPELSGRENIFLNGAILGMTKNEIRKKLDEIVDFAGVERFLDTPVKRYSSGMYVRLAFAVAAHLESEILIVDEVLAVGDAEFQNKCLGKMRDFSKKNGKTVILVSHNMAAIAGTCTKGLLLENGTVNTFGEVAEAIRNYTSPQKTSSIKPIKILNNQIEINTVTINGSDNFNQVIHNNHLVIQISGYAKSPQKIDIELKLKDSNGLPFAFYSDYLLTGKMETVSEGHFSIEKAIQFPMQMNHNTLRVDVAVSVPGIEVLAFGEQLFEIEIMGNALHHHKVYDYHNGAGYLFLTNRT